MAKPDASQKGLHLLTEALAVIDNHAERYSAAEVYRVQGELLLLQATPEASQAETSFSTPSTSPAANRPSHWNSERS